MVQAVSRLLASRSKHHVVLKAVLLSSTVFSLWHLPVRIISLVKHQLDWGMLLISLVMLFLLGVGFSILFIRSQNIFLVGAGSCLMDLL
jgi:membrane protease YdiL (CAAX protease family)